MRGILNYARELAVHLYRTRFIVSGHTETSEHDHLESMLKTSNNSEPELQQAPELEIHAFNIECRVGMSGGNDDGFEISTTSKSVTSFKTQHGTNNNISEISTFHKWAEQMGVEMEKKIIKEDQDIAALGRQMKPKVISDYPVSYQELPCTEYRLTEEMVKEEETIAEETRKEEGEYQRQKDEVMKDMTEETKEKRYKRLCFLLKKCNSYADYLVVRMKEHAELNRIRELKRARKLERRAKNETEKNRCLAELLVSRQSTFNKGDILITETTKNLSENLDMNIDEVLVAKSIRLVPDTERRSSLRSRPTTSSKKKESGHCDASDSQDSQRGYKRGRLPSESTECIDSESRGKRLRMEQSQTCANCPTGSQNAYDVSQDELTTQHSQNLLIVEDEYKIMDQDNNAGYIATIECSDSTPEEDADMRVINGEMVPVGQPLLFEGGVLRDYQMDGFMWLNTMFENGTNGILADEMGLGKTVQVIATIADLVMQRVYGPFIVVAPLSTLPNWMSEFKRFTPRLPVFLYHGSNRKAVRALLNDWFTVSGTSVQTGIIIVTSYEMAMNDSRYLKKSVWKYMVIDEGHRLKNYKCRLIKELSKYHVVNRVLLTGTPLQNNMAELWSLLNFLLPDIFMDLESFESWFDMEALSCDDSTERIIAQERKTNILSMLHQILKPFILRRLKQDVSLIIPPKREVVVYAPLTKQQHFFYAKIINGTLDDFIKERKQGGEKSMTFEAQLSSCGRPQRSARKRTIDYKAMMESVKDINVSTKKRFYMEAEDEELGRWIRQMEENRNIISGENLTKKIGKCPSNMNINLRNTMMLLRKCVNHPYLLEYPLTETGEYKMDEHLIEVSGKLLILDRILPELKKRGHKCLLFSQMTSVLDILEDYCYLRKFTFSRLDGSMDLYTRQEEMEKFRSDIDQFLFLLSTKAGGLGLNLTAADTVIIYDSDWNPQGDLQAQDRCHRIGQTVPVVVYRLVTAGTVDQKMIERAATKRKLEKMIIHQQKFKSTGHSTQGRTKALDTDELVGMLSSHEPDSVFDSHRQSVMSNRVLQQLLDRQDLYEQWLESMDENGVAKRPSKPVNITKDVGVGGAFQIIAEDTEDQLRF